MAGVQEALFSLLCLRWRSIWKVACSTVHIAISVIFANLKCSLTSERFTSMIVIEKKIYQQFVLLPLFSYINEKHDQWMYFAILEGSILHIVYVLQRPNNILWPEVLEGKEMQGKLISFRSNYLSSGSGQEGKAAMSSVSSNFPPSKLQTSSHQEGSWNEKWHAPGDTLRILSFCVSW